MARSVIPSLAWSLLACSLTIGLVPDTEAASSPDFFRGKEIKLLISASAGGGYDAYGRSVGRHLGHHIPGNPTIIPQNMPAAGGIGAANHLYSVAPKDGTTIAIIQNTVPFEPFFENKQAQFDAAKFAWLGSPNAEVALYVIWHTSKIKTIEDAQKIDSVLGGAGASSTPAFFGRIANELFGFRAKLITGYPGQNEIFLAMENGEVEGHPSAFWSSIKATRPAWYPEKKIRFVLQFGLEPHPELPEVPFALDLAKSQADKDMLIAASAPLTLGRPFAAPPNTPPERVAALRQAMLDTFKDPAFLADCEKQKLEAGNIKSGEEIAKIVTQVYATPASVKKRLIAIYQQGSESPKP